MTTRSVHIAASPTAVWKAVTSLERWPSWEPGLTRATGSLMPGQVVELEHEDGKSTSWLVVRHEAGQVLELRSSLFFGAWVTTRIIAAENYGGTTVVEVGERGEGWLSGMSRDVSEGDPLAFARGLARAVREAASSPIESALREGMPVAEVLPGLVDRYRLIVPFEPTLSYRPAGAEEAGHLTAYHLTLYRRHGSAFVPDAVIDDRGYEAWGEGQEEALAFAPRPEELEGPLRLPAVLHLLQKERGLLVERRLLTGVDHEPASVVDAFGYPRQGYGLVRVEGTWLSEARAAAAREAPLIGVGFPGVPRAIAVHVDVLERWQHREPHVFAKPVQQWRDLAGGPGANADLGAWQAGTLEVFGVPA